MVDGDSALSARRDFLFRLASAAAALGPHSSAFARNGDGGSKAPRTPVTGIRLPNLASFDQLMTSFVSDHKLPGAALAVTKDSRLVYARGFGYADVEKQEPVRPTALFRIASVSKPITAVAVLQLVERGKLSLEDKAFQILKYQPHLEPGASVDPRLERITILQLLRHTAGWDREESFDPIARPVEIAKSLGIQLPVRPKQIVRYMMGRPLDFDPGARYAYSNLGYLVLGRVIETISRRPYEDYVRQAVLAPLGITRMRLGRGAVEFRLPGEVKYYDSRQRTGRAVVGPRIGQPVPLPYGAENLDGFEAHGGWVASAVDLARFAAAFDDPAHCPILQEKTIRTMFARPEGAAGVKPDGEPKDAYYGCGWSVRPVGDQGKANTWHTGLIAGTSSLLVRRWDGINWAVLFNTDAGAGGKTPAGEIDPLLHQAADRVKFWPGIDQFGKYLGT